MRRLSPKLEIFLPSSGFNGVQIAGRFAAKRCTAGRLLKAPFSFYCLKNHSPEVSYSTQKAWLSEAGCKLSVGRPPVCYEFLCANILDAQQTGMQRYAMIVLSKLISHIGKKALGSRHLIEVMDPADLKKVRYSRFEKRLSEARNAFDVVQLFFRGHKLENDALKVLSKISRLN